MLTTRLNASGTRGHSSGSQQMLLILTCRLTTSSIVSKQGHSSSCRLNTDETEVQQQQLLLP